MARPGSAGEALASALAAAAARFAAGDHRAALAALETAETLRPTDVDRRRLEILRLRAGAAAGLPPTALLRLPDPPPGGDAQGASASGVGAAFRRLATCVHPDKARGLEGAADAFRALVDAAEAAGAAASLAAGRLPLDRTSGLVPVGAEWWASWAGSDDSDDGALDPALAADAAACAALGVDALNAEVDDRVDAVFDGAAPGTQAAKAARLATARAALAARLATLRGAAAAGEGEGGFLR
jgi:hypothetical protein